MKTGGRNFAPGHKFGKGAPRVPEDIKQLRKLNKEELERILNKYIDMTREELKCAEKDPETKSFDLMIISTVQKAVLHGDYKRINFLLERLVGKVKEQIEVSGNANVALVKVLEKYKEEKENEG